MTITRHFLDVGARRVHYRKSGNGPPLLLVHQSPRSSAEYEPLMSRWGEHFTCVAPDTPGFGQSSPLSGETTIDDFAEATVAFMDAAGLGKVAAYGFHSGGIILVNALKRHAERFSALAIGGYALWTEEEQQIFDESYLPPFRPSEYGEHLTWLWNRMLEQSWFFPWFDVRHEARLSGAHDDLGRVDAAIREMLDSGDAYRAGYGAVLRARRDIPVIGTQSPPVLLTAYAGDPLQAHLERLGSLPDNWSAYPVATPVEHQDASFAFLLERAPPEAGLLPQAGDEGFARVTAQGFDGLIHWRGDTSARRILLHAPGGSSELHEPDGCLLIDLPGHGLSDGFDGAGIGEWAAVVEVAIRAISSAAEHVVVGEGICALLALAVGRQLNAAGVEGIAAHIPAESNAAEWIERQPDLAPDRFGCYLTQAWSVVRASRFFWPWFRSDSAHAVPFDSGMVTAESLAVAHRSLIRARSAKRLLTALLSADRFALQGGAPPIRSWEVADWARRRPDLWRPDHETGGMNANS